MKKRIAGLKKDTSLLDYCVTQIKILGSKTAAKKAIQGGKLRINGQRAQVQDSIKNGDILELKLERSKPTSTNKGIPPIPIIFEDDHLLIVNKPGGIAVNGNRNKTIENVLKRQAKRSTQSDALPHPTAAHRIDVPTKGLVLLAKTKTALIQLNKAFQGGKIEKEYRAVVHGKLKEKGQINIPIQGKRAETHFHLIRTVPSKVFGHLSIVRLLLLTGRTHQLRIHLNAIGHLIVGDKQYAGEQKTILGKGLFLCACILHFKHPITNKQLTITIDSPARFTKLLDREEARFE